MVFFSLAALGVFLGGSIQAGALKPSDYSTLRETVKNIKMPKIQDPEWLVKQNAAEKAKAAVNTPVPARSHGTVTVLYRVIVRGKTSSNFNEFKAIANQTLNDSRGWARMNVRFNEVASGGSFTLVLSEASQLPAFSSACSVLYSCRVGMNVIINDDRWSGATPSWNNTGGSLRDYRHMVINHEVGHWLGHDHGHCSGAGNKAPVMQQQSISLESCAFNPWPLASELTSPTLGIY